MPEKRSWLAYNKSIYILIFHSVAKQCQKDEGVLDNHKACMFFLYLSRNVWICWSYQSTKVWWTSSAEYDGQVARGCGMSWWCVSDVISMLARHRASVGDTGPMMCKHFISLDWGHVHLEEEDRSTLCGLWRLWLPDCGQPWTSAGPCNSLISINHTKHYNNT